MKKKIACLLTFVILFSVSIFDLSIAAGRWVKDGDYWKYEAHAGTGDFVTERFRSIFENGVTEKLYYFDYYGHMVIGPVLIENQLYVFSENGDAVLTGYDIDGVHYNTDVRGKVVGLPTFFDLSRFKPVATMFTATAKNDNYTIYDDNTILMPTVASE